MEGGMCPSAFFGPASTGSSTSSDAVQPARIDFHVHSARMSSKRAQIAIAAAVIIIAGWLFWPSRYARMANLGSHGANIIAFGDSLTAGYGAQPGEDYPSK